MNLGKQRAPAAPDPQKVSAAQTGSNIGTAQANTYLSNINEIGPDGSTIYTYDQKTPVTYQGEGGKTITDYINIPTKRVTLSAAGQQMKDQQDQLGIKLGNISNQAADQASQKYNRFASYSGLPGRTMSVNAPGYDANRFSNENRQVQEAMMSRLSPQFERDRESLEARLANQGIVQNSDAYNRSIDELNRAKTDARFQAVLAGGQEQSRLLGAQNAAFGNALEAASFGNAQRDAAFGEQANEQNQFTNTITGLLSGQQVQTPQSAPYRPGQIAGTDVAGNYWNKYKGDIYSYEQDKLNSKSLFGGLGSIFGTLGSLSDRTFKSDIVLERRLKNGLGWYSYDIHGERESGLMAQEVQEVIPEAVMRFGDVLFVNYERALA